MIGTVSWRRLRTVLSAWRGRRAQERATRARHERLIETLPLPIPFEARAFCEALGARRGRPIVVVPAALGGRVYGLVASAGEWDVIVHERDTSPLHQQQIIIHEACHLILGHRQDGILDADLLSLAEHILGAGLVRHVLGRARGVSSAEDEAEVLASRIVRRAAALQTDGQILAPGVTAALTRLPPFYPPRGE